MKRKYYIFNEMFSDNDIANMRLLLIPRKKVVHLTFPPHIFSLQVKSGACYIMGQWGQVQNKIK